MEQLTNTTEDNAEHDEVYQEDNLTAEGPVPANDKSAAVDKEKNAEEKGEEWLKKKKELEAERIEREKSIMKFQYYMDFVSIATIGLVFFITCLTGILYGVSQKGLSIRAIVSVAIASIVVFICRNIANKTFCQNNDAQGKRE